VLYAEFPATLHEQGPTRVIPLDLSRQLGCPGPATSPSLCANFLHIRPGESIRVRPNASSQLYFVMRGRGRTHFDGKTFPWGPGDFVTLPAGDAAVHEALADAALYWVHDEPMVRLGARVESPTFRPTLYLVKRRGPSWPRPRPTPRRSGAAVSASFWPTEPATRR
jgi:gentisate 1,2-dioxygenase